MFLITGSGRSGTSAVAQILHQAGISVGHDLIEPDENNADGYFEERRLIAINDSILREAGLVDPFTTATRAEVIAAAGPYHEYMRALIAEATPAWKDPRFSWTLEAWLPLLPEPPRLIVCLRNPAEVAASTMRFFGTVGEEPVRVVEHLWRAQYERLLEIIDAYALDARSVEFAELHRRPKTTVRPIERFVGRKLDASSVRRALRHHDLEMPAHLRPLYDRVRALGDPRRPTTSGRAR